MGNISHTSSKKRKKKKRSDHSNFICWALLPSVIIILLILDGLGLYPLNTERLLVIGVCILVILIPLFSEISIKNISFKKEDSHNKKNK